MDYGEHLLKYDAEMCRIVQVSFSGEGMHELHRGKCGVHVGAAHKARLMCMDCGCVWSRMRVMPSCDAIMWSLDLTETGPIWSMETYLSELI